jgi:hypothetical protein
MHALDQNANAISRRSQRNQQRPVIRVRETNAAGQDALDQDFDSRVRLFLFSRPAPDG